MRDDKTGVEQELDSLLRGEIAAAETYRIALDAIEDKAQVAVLRAIQNDHGDAIKVLHGQLAARGVSPSTHSGVFGAFARTVEGFAAKVGDKAALRALREGEEHGLRAYEWALRNDALPVECHRQVEELLLPRQRRHVDLLNRLIALR
jgi:hypothetical protein